MPRIFLLKSEGINCSLLLLMVCNMKLWSLPPWLGLFLPFGLCCGQGVSSLDPEAFAQRAALPGVFVIGCK